MIVPIEISKVDKVKLVELFNAHKNLIEAFDFKDTIEGEDYWNEVADKLANLYEYCAWVLNEKINEEEIQDVKHH